MLPHLEQGSGRHTDFSGFMYAAESIFRYFHCPNLPMDHRKPDSHQVFVLSGCQCVLQARRPYSGVG